MTSVCSIALMKYGGTVYILSNFTRTVLYIGVTSNLLSRIGQHKQKYFPSSFTARYNCDRLVYYENFDRIESAIHKEKLLKKWERKWKIDLINKFNPGWKDLFYEI